MRGEHDPSTGSMQFADSCIRAGQLGRGVLATCQLESRPTDVEPMSIATVAWVDGALSAAKPAQSAKSVVTSVATTVRQQSTGDRRVGQSLDRRVPTCQRTFIEAQSTCNRLCPAPRPLVMLRGAAPRRKRDPWQSGARTWRHPPNTGRATTKARA